LSIYKPCDIRGHAATELSAALYTSWGRVLGRRVGARQRFPVGGDVRRSTPEFLEAFIAGLVASAVDVVELGILPTPMIYFAKRHLEGAAGCAIVTASHNPDEINGLKWMIGNRPPGEDDVAALQRAVETPGAESPDRPQGTRRRLDVSADYLRWLKQRWSRQRYPPQFHVVLDPLHGCWAGRARPYLEAVFPQARFSAIHDTPRPDFGGRTPDCSRREQRQELCREVRRLGADLGIAFDGDGDRVAFVDAEGIPLSAEETTYVFLHSFGTELSCQPFVYDLKFSDCVSEAAAQLGAQPIAERSGHAFIRNRMLQSGALFGAEISGHYFFGPLEGGDDGLYAACRLIGQLARSRKTLADLRRASPAVFLTPDLRLPIPPQDHGRVIEQVRAAWSQYPQTTIDGVRVDFPDGWALTRASVTEAAMTFRFESSGWPALDQLVRRFCDALLQSGDELWRRYQAATKNVAENEQGRGAVP